MRESGFPTLRNVARRSVGSLAETTDLTGPGEALSSASRLTESVSDSEGFSRGTTE